MVHRAGRAAVAVPSPLAGEGAERALASEAGEGNTSTDSSEETPSPGLHASVYASGINLMRCAPPSPAGGEGFASGLVGVSDRQPRQLLSLNVARKKSLTATVTAVVAAAL
jgi:hypothetical protein